MQEKLIRLICIANELEENYMCNCGCCDDIMTDFIDELNKIFSRIDELNELSPYIRWLNLSVFTNENYKSADVNDDIRNAIEEVYNSDIEAKKINFDYDLIYQYIEYASSLINYLDNVSVEQLISLASKNPKVLYFVSDFSIDTLKEIIKNNSEASLIIDVDVMDDDKLYETYLYKNRDKFLEDSELYKLYIDGLKKSLIEDRMKYIHMSDVAHNDISLADFILEIEPKFIAYVGDNVYDNKQIMMKMISIDKTNEYYLSDRLKDDNDIKRLLHN